MNTGLFEPLQSLLASSRIEPGRLPAATLLEHSLKCAQAALDHGAGDILLMAALFHDIGHAFKSDMDEFGEMPDLDEEHAALGARYLERFFPQEVCRLIADHVEAKRYRAAQGVLPPSLGSRRSLLAQGNAMSPEECRRFELLPHFSQVLLLREWDDHCDQDILQAAPLEAYLPAIGRTRIR